MLVNKDFEECFALLNAHKVRFLLVGGYAVAFHGAPRYTGDIDVFYVRSPRNAQSLLAALHAFGFAKVGLAETDFLSCGRIVQLGHPPNRIDFINEIDGVSFQTAWRSRVRDHYGDVPIFYIGKTPLLKNKRASGRTKDQLDLQRLEAKTSRKRRRA